MKRLFATILLTFLLTGFQPAALANISIASSSPTERQINFVLKEGESKTGAVIVDNLDSKDATVSLYGADGTLSNQGTFAITTKSASQKTIGKWVQFETPTVTLKGNEQRQIPFTITIPANATPGTYGGGIAAETTNGNGSVQTGNAVSVSSRVVVKLYVSIPGEKKTSFEWSNFSYNPGSDSKKPFFNLSYANTGNTIINAEQKIDIQGFPGFSQTVTLPTASLPQGSSIDIPVRWDNPPLFGYLKATATTTFSEYNIINNKNINGQTLSKSMDIVIVHPLILVAAGIIVILIILLTAILAIRYCGRCRLLKKCASYTVQEKETLAEIAEKSGIGWKKLAKLNKLKAPYNLKAGSCLRVPGYPKK
jgi:uncharacterized membrane protein